MAWLGKDPDWEVHYACFGRQVGSSLMDVAEAEYDVHVYTPEDVMGLSVA